MLRIGFMLDSHTVSAWQAHVIEEIQKSDFTEVALIVLNTPPAVVQRSLRQRLKAHWQRTAFHRYTGWDYMRNKGNDDANAARDLGALLADVPTLQVEPMRKGFTDRFQEEDLAKIRAAELDVLFRFGFRIIRGPILETARCGVWSFHHDDNLEYRGGPHLFWEIYESNPTSGSILQILTDSLDGGRVIYRSHSSTNKSSLYLNRNPILWKTAEFALRRLRDLDRYGIEYLHALPTYNEQIPYTRGIYHTPNTIQMGSFTAAQISRRVLSRLRSLLDGTRQQWFLALRKRSSVPFSSTEGYKPLSPPNDRFYADPFLLEREGRTHLFFEDYRYSEKRALISYSEVLPDGSLTEPIEVLRRPYHLSYPFVFARDGEIYMIPETLENRAVELYRAEEFPLRWTKVSALLEDICAVDATLHEQDGKLWMFVGTSNERYSSCDELSIFYADALSGPWTPHPMNPVVSDVRRARPAGRLFYEDGQLLRPSQDCSETYGGALNFYKVLKLSETEYEEQAVARITPDWLKANRGAHTYTRSTDFEVIDGKRMIKPRRGGQ